MLLTTYLMTTMRVRVHRTMDVVPMTSSTEGWLMKTEGHRYSGDVPAVSSMQM